MATGIWHRWGVWIETTLPSPGAIPHPPLPPGGVSCSDTVSGPCPPPPRSRCPPFCSGEAWSEGWGAAGKSRLPQGKPGHDSSLRGTLKAQTEQEKLQGTLTQPREDRRRDSRESRPPLNREAQHPPSPQLVNGRRELKTPGLSDREVQNLDELFQPNRKLGNHAMFPPLC